MSKTSRWVGLVLALVCSLGFAQDLDCSAHHCMAVIDAGSTKSYLHLYQYDVDEKGKPTAVEAKWSKKITPGIASIDLKQMSVYLESLLKDAPQQVYPIYLYATGGMRLLPYPQQAKLYQSVQSWFAQQPTLQLVEAKTITGKEEGIYDWLAVNYQLEGQGTPTSFGVMDMGGASVQVVLPVQDSHGLDPKDLITLSWRGEPVTLFVHSFLGLGQTEVSHQLMEEPGCYPNGYVMPDGSLAQMSVENCQKKIQYLIQLHETASVVQTAIKNNPTSGWFVMGGLAALANKSPLHFDAQTGLTPQRLLFQGSSAFCEPSWSILSQQYPNDTYLWVNCLATVYYHDLLVKGYGFHPDTGIYYSQDDKFDEWTLGVVLYHATP